MSSITLHKEKGVNPHLTFCQRCGGEAPSIVLIGNKDYIDICNSCGMRHYGGADKRTCQGCGTKYSFKREKMKEGERLPGGLCDACEKEVAEHKAIVASGGAYFKCADCGVEGVIKANDFTASVREANGLDDTEPFGVEFNKDDCPKCADE